LGRHSDELATMPTSGFAQIIKEKRDELVQTIVRRLKASNAPHYRRADRELLQTRVERLVDSFVRSTRGDHVPFVAYVEKLTEERISEGYHLQEIQLVLSVLEELAWKMAVEHTNVVTLLPSLSMVTSTIGHAKDRLAQIYLARMERCESRCVTLEKQRAALFKGTDGHALPED
jgi:hypothetical protein